MGNVTFDATANGDLPNLFLLYTMSYAQYQIANTGKISEDSNALGCSAEGALSTSAVGSRP